MRRILTSLSRWLRTLIRSKNHHWEHARGNLRSGMSDRERAIALATWVVENSTLVKDHPKDSRGYPFYGLCGTRAEVFAALARRSGLKARVTNIYNFGGGGWGGHSTAEVMLDQKWRFFDVTYAGYFEKNGSILGLTEISKCLCAARNALRPIHGTRDRLPGYPLFNNQNRMHYFYKSDAVSSLGNFSVVDELSPIPFFVTLTDGVIPGDFHCPSCQVAFDWKEMVCQKCGKRATLSLKKEVSPPIVLGSPDGSPEDLDSEALKLGVGYPVSYMLGSEYDNFQPRIQINRLAIGERYELTLIGRSFPGLAFKVRSDSADMLDGQEFGADNKERATWTIVFKPNKESVRLDISHEIRRKVSFRLNCIKLSLFQNELA